MHALPGACGVEWGGWWRCLICMIITLSPMLLLHGWSGAGLWQQLQSVDWQEAGPAALVLRLCLRLSAVAGGVVAGMRAGRVAAAAGLVVWESCMACVAMSAAAARIVKRRHCKIKIMQHTLRPHMYICIGVHNTNMYWRS